ncbi:MAG: nucleoside-diphosphate kinase [Chlamydiae bacterium]|nr:nucleoside-diphosphate kinase [Chlamydiota bacterium]
MKKIFIFIGLIAALWSISSYASCGCCGKTAVQRTLSIVKPDAVSSGHIGDISARFEQEGLKIVAAKMVKLSKEKAGSFYAVHKERPFYASLVDFMSSGPIFVMVLEGDDAVAKNRQIMGATHPGMAAEGTLRALYATDVEKNAVHGSDSRDSAKQEIAFFFSEKEIFAK